jgi:hypothetical protein
MSSRFEPVECGRVGGGLRTRQAAAESLEHRLLLSAAVASSSATSSPAAVFAGPVRVDVVAHALKKTNGLWGVAAAGVVGRPAGADSDKVVNPRQFAHFAIKGAAVKAALAKAPREFTAKAATSAVVITLPKPDGTFARFKVVDAPIMDPALAAQFPGIKTYRGQGVDDKSASVRLDYTPLGFHAQVLTNDGQGTWYVDPYQTNVPAKGGNYASYYRTDLPAPTDAPKDIADDVVHVADKGFGGGSADLSAVAATPAAASLTSGTQLRTYRAAVAADGEYTAFYGGTVANAQAAIVTSINRVTGIYEREVACRLVLVANNASLIYTNANTDPYTNTDPSALLSQNQSNVDTLIGNANYDIGHVFTTGGGGLAGLGVVCRTGQKAQGETGSSSPIGDAYDVDYVAHEMGHQFGGNHTFNGVNGSAAGNANAATAFEPGSGSTIQAYAGICGPDDLQTNSDAYFHSVSLDEIVAYTTTGAGNAVTATSTGNTAPVVNGGLDYAIPTGTPFALTATGSDANGDTLTYDWEERDAGPLQALSAADNGTSPIIRSFAPTSSPTRTVPRLSNLLANTFAVGEKLPSVARTMKFRVVARDNRSGGGGIGTDDVVLNVVNTGAAFAVSAPNTAVSWAGGSTQTVTWNVAGTRNAPIGAAQVNIKLSTDGGNTFPVTLAAGTPNDGSQAVNLPVGTASTTARIKVEAVGNIFFDLSNANFTLTAGTIAADRFEANETRAAATDLGGNYARTENQLSIHAAGDEDWFQFAAATAGAYSAGLALTNAQGNVDLFVYDGAGTLLGSSTTATNAEVVNFTAAALSTYYVRAVGASGATNPNYGLTIAGPAPAGATGIGFDRFEPNDTFATSWDLGTLRTRTDTGMTIHTANNDDYYKFKAAATGSATVSLAFTNAQGNVDLFVYNAAQTQIGSSTTTNNAESATISVTSGQTYYVKVAGAAGATSPAYDLTVAGPAATGDRFEPNDSFAAAYDFAGTPDRTETGLSVHVANNDDYYKFVPAVSGTLTASISLNGSVSDLDLYLYNASQTLLTSAETVASVEQVSATVTAGQTYYLRVNGYQGSTGAYDFTLDVPNATASVAPTVQAAAYVAAPTPPALRYAFSQDVSAALGLADLTVQNLSAGGTVTPASLGYDVGSNEATVKFAAALAAGNYRATLTAAGVTNAAGTPLPANSVFDFTVVASDVVAPTVASAVSRKTHGSAGTFDLPLDLSGAAANATVEPRRFGVTGAGDALEVTFSEAVQGSGAGGSVSPGQFTVTGGTIGSASISGTKLLLGLSGVTDQGVLTITLAGISDLAGNALGGTVTVYVRHLAGDATQNRSVAVSDLQAIKNTLGQTLAAANFLTDLNVSGSISVSDLQDVKNNLSHAVA